MSNIAVMTSVDDLPDALWGLDYQELYNLILKTDEMVADSEFTETLIKRLVISLKESLGDDMDGFMVELNASV